MKIISAICMPACSEIFTAV